MKKNFTIALFAASLAWVSCAQAAQITGKVALNGYATAYAATSMGTATGYDFVAGANGTPSPGTAGGLTSFGAGTGSFAGLSASDINGGAGTIKDIASFTTSAPITTELVLNTGGPAISFDLTSITAITHDINTDVVSVKATGIIHFSGFSDTAGTLLLSAQGENVTSFSGTLTTGPVPEPASLLLLSAPLGLLLRRRAARSV